MPANSPSATSGVIFDLDGTLADTLDDITDAMNEVFVEFGLPAVATTQMRAIIGEGLSVLMTRASHIDDPDLISKLVQRYRPAYDARMLRRTHLYPGVAAMLDALADRGVKMCVLSNKPHEFTTRICDVLLSPWPFVRCAGHREGGARKPEPAVALEMAREMRSVPPGMYFIGDSAIDVQTGRNAGMRTIAVTWGYRDRDELLAADPTHLVDSPEQLPRLISNP